MYISRLRSTTQPRNQVENQVQIRYLAPSASLATEEAAAGEGLQDGEACGLSAELARASRSRASVAT